MNEWVWGIGGMIVTGEIGVVGEKHCWNETDKEKPK